MQPKIRVILEKAIEEGARHGYARAYKHNDDPSDGAVIEAIGDAVMDAIYDYFTFDKEGLYVD
jgi:hypothetical protein